MKKVLFYFLMSLYCLVQAASAQTVDVQFPQTNGSIETIASLGDTLFVGGQFTKIYGGDSSSTYGALLASNTSSVTGTWPKPNGTIFKTISDGKKGFFVGGDFTKIGDSARNNIAHIDSNGIVSSVMANYGSQGIVSDIKLRNDTLYVARDGYLQAANVGDFIYNSLGIVNTNNNTLYNTPKFNSAISCVVADGYGGWLVAGSFSKVGDKEQRYLARLDCSGNLMNWDAQIDATVLSITVDKGTAYLSGHFSTIGNTTRKYLAAINVQTGNVTNWNPSPNNIATKTAIYGNTLYVCGPFTTIGGQNRNGLAAISLSNGNATSWNPNPSTEVLDILVAGNTLYVGGRFYSIAGQFISRFAAFNLPTGNINTSFNGDVNNAVFGIAANKNNVYIAGSFTHVQGQKHVGVASFEIATNTLRSWDPNFRPFADATSIACTDSIVYIGGLLFDSVGTEKLGNFVAVNANTGILAQQPNLGVSRGTVTKISTYGNKVTVGGDFDAIGGIVRYSIYSVDLSTNSITKLNPANGSIKLELNGNYGYAISNNSSSTKVVEFNLTTSEITNFQANFSFPVYTLYAYKDKLFASGDFSSVNNNNIRWLAAFDLTTKSLLTNWNPSPSGVVYDMFGLDDTLYVCGDIGITNIIGINITTGLPTNWKACFSNKSIRSMTLIGDTLYFGGDFTKIDNVARNYLAAINFKTKKLTDWNPDANNNVITINASDTRLYAGGEFTAVGGYFRKNFAAINQINGSILPLKVYINKFGVSTILASGNTVFIGGTFDTAGNQKRDNLAAIDLKTGQILSWNPGTNSGITAFHLQGNSIYVGGSFTTIGGTNRRGLAELNATTGVVSSWNPLITSGYVRCFAQNGNTLYIGGTFSSLFGQSRNGVAAINLNSKTLTGWNANMNSGSNVITMKVLQNTLYIGGSFNSINGKTRQNIVSFETSNGYVKNWNPSATSAVFSIDGMEDKIFIGGNFYFVNGIANTGFVALDTGTAAIHNNWATNLNPSTPYNNVGCILIHKGSLFAGGDFTYTYPYHQKYLFRSSIKKTLSIDSISTAPNCIGGGLKIPFTISSEANSSNIFTAELSNAEGCFDNPIIIGSLTGNSSGVISAKLPSNITPSAKYRLRVISSSPPLISPDNGFGITVSQLSISTGFIADTLLCSSPYITNFTDTSTIAQVSNPIRIWKFTDGTSDTSLSITKTFLSEGIYNATLIISGNGCVDSTTKSIYISKKPVSTIVHDEYNNCSNLNLFRLADTSIINDSIYHREWFFQDGTKDTAQNFLKSFNTYGQFIVGLKASNLYCTDTAYDTLNVYPTPTAGFIVNNDEQCFNSQSFSLTDTSLVYTGITSSRKWYFSDSSSFDSLITINKTFKNSGQYNASLKIITNKGCSDSVSQTLKVNPNPKPSMLYTDTAFCDGDSSFFATNNVIDSHINWYNDFTNLNDTNPVLVVKQTGKYFFKAQNVYGCDSSTQPVQVNVYPSPPKPIITRNASILYSSSKTNNQWIFNGSDIGGATDTFYSFTSNGSYQVKVKLNNCEAISDSIQILNVSTNNNNHFINNYKIYPNPIIEDDIIIETTFSQYSIEVFSIEGKLLILQDNNSNNTKVSLTTLPKGMYFVVLKSAEGLILAEGKIAKM